MESRTDLTVAGSGPSRLSVVRTVFPVESRGTRLRHYLAQRTGGRRGWVNDLAAKSGVKRQTLSAMMGDRSAPDLKTIDAIADALEIRPFEIVAAMDGDVALSVADPRVRQAIRDEIDAALDEREKRGKRRSA
jgi:transcriptional regulator with XRE-family HTH domain